MENQKNYKLIEQVKQLNFYLLHQKMVYYTH